MTRMNELAAISSQKKKNESVFAEATTRTIARMKRFVQPARRFLRDPPPRCSPYSVAYRATHADTAAMIRRKNAASRSMTNERENPANGWMAVNARVSPPRRIRTEMMPRKSEASMVQDNASVLTILKSRR